VCWQHLELRWRTGGNRKEVKEERSEAEREVLGERVLGTLGSLGHVHMDTNLTAKPLKLSHRVGEIKSLNSFSDAQPRADRLGQT